MLYVGESAKSKIVEIRADKNMSDDYFVRVSVTSGGCSGLSYQMDFDNEGKPNDQKEHMKRKERTKGKRQ